MPRTTTTKKAAPKPKTTTTRTRTKAQKSTTPASTTATYETVAERAYFLWIDRGCPQGCDEDIWFQAERDLANRAA